MNKKGFTLIEIISVIVIIGILAGIGVAAVSNSAERTRKANFTHLVRAYGDSLRAMRAEDKLIYEPRENEALVFPLSELDGVQIENKNSTAYGDIVPEYSYAGLQRYGSGYKYYVTMLDTTGHAMREVEYNDIDEDKIEILESIPSDYGKLSVPITTFNVVYNTDTYTLSWIRVKYTATYNSGADSKTLYAYYADTDPGYSCDIKGSYSDYNLLEQSLRTGSVDKTIKGVTYNITESELLYALVTK